MDVLKVICYVNRRNDVRVLRADRSVRVNVYYMQDCWFCLYFYYSSIWLCQCFSTVLYFSFVFVLMFLQSGKQNKMKHDHRCTIFWIKKIQQCRCMSKIQKNIPTISHRYIYTITSIQRSGVNMVWLDQLSSLMKNLKIYIWLPICFKCFNYSTQYCHELFHAHLPCLHSTTPIRLAMHSINTTHF